MAVVVVVTGVSGSGKSTVGAALADRWGWSFVDGDDLHSVASVEKMRRGVALDDADRAPWLARLQALIRARVDDGAPTVVACSALRRRYRDQLRAGSPPGTIQFVHLDVDRQTLEQRLATRRGHYMLPSLLASQLATLEPPTADEALTVKAEAPVDQVVTTITATVGSALG